MTPSLPRVLENLIRKYNRSKYSYHIYYHDNKTIGELTMSYDNDSRFNGLHRMYYDNNQLRVDYCRTDESEIIGLYQEWYRRDNPLSRLQLKERSIYNKEGEFEKYETWYKNGEVKEEGDSNERKIWYKYDSNEKLLRQEFNHENGKSISYNEDGSLLNINNQDEVDEWWSYDQE